MTASSIWWAPVRRGLVVDHGGKHFRRLGRALWLLLYLFLHADRRSGFLARKQATIAGDTGIPLRTIRAWMRRLERDGYIAVQRSGRAQRIRVLRWAGTRRHVSAGQSGSTLPIRAAGNGQGPSADRRNLKQPGGEFGQGRLPYNIPSTRDLLQQRRREEALARELAESLGDRDRLDRYRRYARGVPEGVLRKCLGQVAATPAERIKKSKAALFAYLLSMHVCERHKNPRA